MQTKLFETLIQDYEMQTEKKMEAMVTLMCIYLLTVITYFCAFMRMTEDTPSRVESVMAYFVAVLTLLDTVLVVLVEGPSLLILTQFLDSSWVLLSTLLNLCIPVVFSILKIWRQDANTLHILAALAVFMCFLRLIKMLRFWPELALYVYLIKETFIGISDFLKIYGLILLMFCCTIFILNNLDKEPLFGEHTGNPLYDVAIFIWHLSLGELDYDKFGNQYYVWYFYLLATLTVQIVILNMIIALMSQIFD